MDRDHALRRHLVKLLSGREAHVSMEDVLRQLTPELAAAKPSNSPHTIWQLLEHMRIAQWDILQFCRDPRHRSPDFPEGYWPAQDVPPDREHWEQTIKALQEDLQRMIELVLDPASDLFDPIPHGTGQTLLREALLVADHNAYHLGQMVLLLKQLGRWPSTSPLSEL